MAYYLVEITPVEGSGHPAAALLKAEQLVVTHTSKDSLRFKVFGENKIVFIGKDEEPQKVLDGLNTNIGASVKMTTTPVRLYESFAQNVLRVDPAICELKTMPFQNPQRLFFYCATIGLPGMGMEEFKEVWKAEAESALGVRAKGLLDFRVFKTVATRSIVGFFNVACAEVFDEGVFQVPLALDPRTANDLRFPVLKEVKTF